MHPFELTKQLMSIPSVTGTEGKVAQFLASFLEGEHYRVDTQRVTEDRFNVMAYAGDPKIVFCTHLDTVPPHLPVSEDDSALYGRGACDTKGIIAAMVQAADRLREGGFLNFAFLLVVGEEMGGDGAKLANTLSWDSEYLIVGEPTENKLARAQKGTILADLVVRGKAAHSGYPEMGVSSVEPLVDILHECIRADWGKDPVLGSGSFNAGVLEAGECANIVAPEARASVMLRTVEEVAAAEKRLRQQVHERAEIHVRSASPPQYMHVVNGFDQTVVSFGSDIPYLGNLGKALLVGPGSILDAHSMKEKILKEQLLEGIDIYHRLACQLTS